MCKFGVSGGCGNNGSSGCSSTSIGDGRSGKSNDNDAVVVAVTTVVRVLPVEDRAAMVTRELLGTGVTVRWW